LNLVARAIGHLKRLRRHPSTVRFMRHNRPVFGRSHGQPAKGRVVLIELNDMQSAHIAYSYLANVLATDFKAGIAAYVPRAHPNRRQRLAFELKKLLRLEELGVYESFGVTDFISIRVSSAQKQKARELLSDIRGKLHSKRDVEELTINGVWLGDLIYDTYLKRFSKPTIELDSPDFQRSLQESLELFSFWEGYFDRHEVQAVSVSHCVYDLAIPLRVAVARNIPVFQASATHTYRMSREDLFAYNDFHYFRERFAALPRAVQKAGVEEARRRIDRRFAGKVGVDMAYSSRSAYGAARHERLLRESPKKKILIATHCFFDSPHSYGKNIFPDFYEWLDFLGKISEVTDYDWYIKTHPDYLAGTKEIIENFIARYPRLTLLPSDASHHQIIAEGIDVALTVYGTIAFEYAALGIPVINNSLNNPHIAYGFNLHSRDVEDYRRLLLGLDTLDFRIPTEQVYEYYFMRHIYNTEDLFFDSYEAAEKALGGYKGQFSPAVYERWLDEWSPEKHSTILAALRRFVQSGDFRMDYSHYGREISVESIVGKQ
jgi:hypothetical protein